MVWCGSWIFIEFDKCQLSLDEVDERRYSTRQKICCLCLLFPDVHSVLALITVKIDFGVVRFAQSMFFRVGQALSGQNFVVIEVLWHPRTYAMSTAYFTF